MAKEDFNRIAIIVGKKEKNSEKIYQIITDALVKHKKLWKKEALKGDFTLGIFRSGIGELSVFTLKDIFRNYKDYDNFLIELVQDYGFDSLKHNGLLLGHTDSGGYLWTDYNSFKKGKNEKER